MTTRRWGWCGCWWWWWLWWCCILLVLFALLSIAVCSKRIILISFCLFRYFPFSFCCRCFLFLNGHIIEGCLNVRVRFWLWLINASIQCCLNTYIHTYIHRYMYIYIFLYILFVYVCIFRILEFANHHVRSPLKGIVACVASRLYFWLSVQKPVTTQHMYVHICLYECIILMYECMIFSCFCWLCDGVLNASVKWWRIFPHFYGFFFLCVFWKLQVVTFSYFSTLLSSIIQIFSNECKCPFAAWPWTILYSFHFHKTLGVLFIYIWLCTHRYLGKWKWHSLKYS